MKNKKKTNFHSLQTIQNRVFHHEEEHAPYVDREISAKASVRNADDSALSSGLAKPPHNDTVPGSSLGIHHLRGWIGETGARRVGEPFIIAWPRETHRGHSSASSFSRFNDAFYAGVKNVFSQERARRLREKGRHQEEAERGT